MSTKGLKDFQMDLKEFEQKIMPNAHSAFVRRVALEVFTGVVKMTPVDTGLLKGNWLVSIGTPDEDITDTKDKSKTGSKGTVTLSKGTEIINKSDPTKGIIYIQNNLPYAESIENGHSTEKAPQGMVEVTLNALKEKMSTGLL